MSHEPRPYRMPSASRDGRLPASGTVSRCPPNTTRSARPSCVRAITVFPSRSTSSHRCRPKAASTASASGASWWLSDGTSTRAAVNATTSASRSRSTSLMGCSHIGTLARVTQEPAPTPTGASAHGVATYTADGTLLDAWFPAPVMGLNAHDVDGLTALVGDDALRGVHVSKVHTVIPDLSRPARDAADMYLRLHLLSHRLVPPHGLSMDGVFGLLANVVWTSAGPCAVSGFEEVRLRLRGAGPLTVHGIDKFPRMVDYVVPTGVRIADADRVRLGAHLASGTTVMHEGFVNYNAGTLGTSMVEGRISAGVVVGEGSDIGGGASVM